MNTNLYIKIIRDYIKAYNSFAIEDMLLNMHENVQFINISDGEVILTTNGIAELKDQAEEAKHYFKAREQIIREIKWNGEEVEIDIDFKAILAIDFPNGLKAGDLIAIKGKSIFRFLDNKIVELKDIS